MYEDQAKVSYNPTGYLASSFSATTTSADVAGQGIVEEFSQHISTLEQQIASLEQRLDPICRPNYPEKDSGEPVQAVSSARNQVNRLIALQSRIVALNERLEV